MKVNIYLKGGQTITLDHIKDVETKRNQLDDTLSAYSFTYFDKGLPAKAVKLHTCMLSEVAAITTEDR